MTAVTKPDWIAVGSQVLCFNTGTNTLNTLTVASIEKVTATTFTVSDGQGRFKIAENPQRSEGGSWGWSRRVIPVASDQAQDLIQRRREQQTRDVARAACSSYNVHPTYENRMYAIVTLQAVTKDSTR